MKIVNYGVDRLKFSFKDYELTNEDVFAQDFSFTSNKRGWHWYRGTFGSIGFSQYSRHCVVELYSLFFIKNCNSFYNMDKIVKKYLSTYFKSHSEIKITRLDTYIDYEGTEVYPLYKRYYTGRSKTSLFTANPEDDEIGTSYLQAKSKAWTIRRYDKTADISDKDIEHRYPDIYKQGVVRTEYSYTKECFKKLQSQSLSGAFGYVARQLEMVDIPESKELLALLNIETQPGKVEYKTKKGNYSGARAKAQIEKRTQELQNDYVALGGNQVDLITKLIEARNK